MTAFDMMNNAQNNLSQTLVESNDQLEVASEANQVININGDYWFENEESMDSLLNKIGLAVQRQGGQNVN